MPRCHIVRESKISDSFRVAQVRGMFDYQAETTRHEWDSFLPVEDRPWKIGLIVGPSGSGKTTLAREAFQLMRFHEGFTWDGGTVIDGFPPEITTKNLCMTLNSVGFSSPPSWLKPFYVLSNGQKFRAELARCILTNNTGVVFDEFTSVVDRDVAKIGCAAIEKAIRKKESPPFVAVSCHYDIIDWLQPDWVFDVGAQRFEWRERRQRPEIKLDISRTTTAAWEVFRPYHYLDHHIHKYAECFIATWESKPVAFVSVLHFPHPSCSKFKREHRTVVLPDFQGVGIGNKISEFVAEIYKQNGYRFISTTSAPSMIMHRSKSPFWRTHRFGNASRPGPNGIKRMTVSAKRITAGFEFIGKGLGFQSGQSEVHSNENTTPETASEMVLGNPQRPEKTGVSGNDGILGKETGGAEI